MIRQPICVLLAHVDHGKTSILDRVRESSIASKEEGGITQSIKAYSIPLENIKKICGDLIKNINLTIPGILFIDSPGHEAFTTLRKRGGNIADIAILVIDITEGSKPQTLESLEILKKYKTPFIVAANKLDLISGWRPDNKGVLQNFNEQQSHVQQNIEEKLYKIVGELSENGFNSERFDRIKDYTKEIAIVPVSAKTGEGFPELLMLISGLAQRYFEKSLEIDKNKPGKGTILEITEEKGVGKILDLVLYDGTIKQGDEIIIGSADEPIISKVKSMFIFEKKLQSVKEASGSAALKISLSSTENIQAGMPLYVVKNNLEELKEQIKKEIDEVIINTDNKGIIIKADTLGSLEAVTSLLKKENINIKKAGIGNISKKDVMDALSEENELNKIIVGFNVNILEDSKEVKIINEKIIYKAIDKLKEYIEKKSKYLETKEISNITKPFKLRILNGCIFRQSGPCVVGVEILEGTLKNNSPIFKDLKKIGEIKSVQKEKENVQEAKRNDQVAISIPGLTAGRQIKEGDILYSEITEEEFKKLKELKKYLNTSEVQVLKEIADIKRNEKPTWGI